MTHVIHNNKMKASINIGSFSFSERPWTQTERVIFVELENIILQVWDSPYKFSISRNLFGILWIVLKII
jgi:hypothetical protein